jgi:hypothetical protein
MRCIWQLIQSKLRVLQRRGSDLVRRLQRLGSLDAGQRPPHRLDLGGFPLSLSRMALGDGQRAVA